DRTPTGRVANPAPGLQVQFTDGDRLHVHIVTHFLSAEGADAPGLSYCDSKRAQTHGSSNCLRRRVGEVFRRLNSRSPTTGSRESGWMLGCQYMLGDRLRPTID